MIGGKQQGFRFEKGANGRRYATNNWLRIKDKIERFVKFPIDKEISPLIYWYPR